MLINIRATYFGENAVSWRVYPRRQEQKRMHAICRNPKTTYALVTVYDVYCTVPLILRRRNQTRTDDPT